MVTYLPGPAQTLGPALAQLIQGVGHAVAPEFETKRALEKALVSNPQLLQQLADLEHTSPGAVTEGFKKYLSPNVTNALSRAQPSPGAIQARQTASILTTPVDELPKKPTLGQILATRETTGKSSEELADAARSRQALLDYVSSQKDPARRAIISVQAMQDIHFLEGLKAQQDAYASRNAREIQDHLQRRREQNALSRATKYGGNVDQWLEYLYGDGQEKAEKLIAEPPSTLTADDVALLEIHRANQSIPAEQRITEITKIRNDFQRTTDILFNRRATGAGRGPEKITDELRPMYVSMLNMTLKEFKRIGGPEVRAVPVASSYMGFVAGGVKFLDKDDNEIPENMVWASLDAVEKGITPQGTAKLPSTPGAAPPAAPTPGAAPAAPAPTDTSTAAAERQAAIEARAQTFIDSLVAKNPRITPGEILARLKVAFPGIDIEL